MRLRGGLVLTILGLGLAACGGHEKPKAAEPGAGPAKDVKTADVVRSGGMGEVAVPAAVQARNRAALSARMPASVTELPYREGQWVQAGAVVVRLDDGAVRAAVAAAEANLEATESDLDRTKALLEKGAATPRELEQMTAAASGARAQLTAARDNLSYTALRAPFAGRVASRRVNLGDVVNPGMPLIEIEGEGGLELRATVESEIAATLRAARAVVGEGHLVVAFQAHHYYRTAMFVDEFGEALGLADQVVVLEVYAPGEDPIPGASGQSMASHVPLPPDQVVFEPSWSAVAGQLADRARPGDIVMTLGAGDIVLLGQEVLDLLAQRHGAQT